MIGCYDVQMRREVNMFEVEIKASLGKSTIGDVTEKAVELGFIYDRTLREVDTYFNGNDRDFRKTDEALRIRACERWREDVTGTGCSKKESEAFITYKGPKLDDVSGTRKVC